MVEAWGEVKKSAWTEERRRRVEMRNRCTRWGVVGVVGIL
jgi:hypothetical protein